jgi:hypothetical protein
MTGKTFFNGLANGKRDILARFLEVLNVADAAYCTIGGLAVNAYADPVVSLDFDVVIAVDKLETVCRGAEAAGLFLERFEHSVNLASADSDLRIQLQIDPRYQSFLKRSVTRDVLGYTLHVAAIEDVLQGKVWAYLDETRRRSKRQKDLADIMRLVETYPRLQEQLPESVRARFD